MLIGSLKTKPFMWLVIIGLSFQQLYAQEFQWAKSFGGTEADRVYDIEVDQRGNLYVIGSFKGTADFDPGANSYDLTSEGMEDIYFAKFNNGGNLIWARQIGDTLTDLGLSIAVDSGSNVFIAGYFQGVADFDPGAGIADLTSNGSYDIFMAKYDSAGQYIWAHNLGSAYPDRCYDLDLDDTGNVYIAGAFDDIVDFDPGPGTAILSSTNDQDGFFAKYDNSGNYVWAKSLKSSGWNPCSDIGIDKAGNVYITGFYEGTADFDPGASTVYLTSSHNWDGFVAKYDHNGDYVWARSFGGSWSDNGSSLAIDDTGNVYVTGSISYDADFDPGSGTGSLTTNGDMDMFFAKYNRSGDFLFAKNIGGISSDIGDKIAIDDKASIHITGYFEGNVDFNPGVGTANLIGYGDHDIYMAVYDSLGNFEWAVKGGGATGNDSGRALALDNYGGIYLTGIFAYYAEIDTGTGGAALWSAGSSDIFVSKFKQSCYGFYVDPTIDRNVSCYLGSDGKTTASLNGGVSPFQYTWSNGQTNATAENLTAGSYSVTVYDSLGCKDSALVLITEPTPVEASVFTVANGCNGASDGTAALVPSGGTPGYSYSWSSGGTDSTETGLSAGNYSVTIKDANNCNFDTIVTIVEPTAFSVVSTSTDDSLQNCDVELTLAVSGATPPYYYQWNDPNQQTTSFATGLCSATYEVVIKDSVDCDTLIPFNVTDVFITGLLAEPMKQSNHLKLYPNPGNGHYRISIPGTSLDSVMVYIADLSGKLVFQNEYQNVSEIDLDLSELVSGIYFMKIKGRDRVRFGRFVQQKVN